ncbi:divergent polysaccharide deacetylase family protein [Niveispirillum fermenti]|uniref:divergent polysaccharide deacetylase family protein n=1 Tax=Niveispirillum fermenti TaxID=1233113 RepID=UPI003A85FA4E
MPLFPFTRKNKSKAGATAGTGGGSAAVLASRFGVRRGGATAGADADAKGDEADHRSVPGKAGQRFWDRVKPRGGRGKGKAGNPFSDSSELSLLGLETEEETGGNGRKAKGPARRARPSPPAIAALLLVLAMAGVAVVLAVKGPETVARLDAARGLGSRIVILLPDGSPRFAPPATAAPVEEAPLDPVDMPVTLTPSRNDMLVERLRVGRVPRVAPDGTTAWQYYARPFPQEDQRPRIAIILTGLGLSHAATQAAIDRLPSAVTFAFPPSGQDLQARVDDVRAKGHEVLLAVPLQPAGYPANDPGPNTLLTNLSDEENTRRLEASMAAFTGYVGVTSRTDSGTAFLTQRDNVRGLLQQVHRRGLLYVDLWQVAGSKGSAVAKELSLPRVISDLQIDRVPSVIGIDAQLAQLEQLAKANGVAVGFAEATYPVSVERLSDWAVGLRDRGIVLAPVSAVVNRQADR